MRIRWTVAVVVVAMFGVVLVPAASADDTVTPLCNGQACAGGWYTSPVFLSWSWTGGTATSGCGSQDYLSDTNQIGQPSSCTVSFSDGSGTLTRTYVLKVEISPPTANATLARPPDSNGWYNHPVALSFSGGAFSGIASCSPTNTYGGPAGGNVTINGSCTDNAGKVATTSASIEYDATPPTITGATASRKPDSNGYYTHPVTFQFNGVDGISGIASCDAVTYSGPASGNVVGGCHDNAGNYAAIPVPVKYRAATPVASVARAGSSLRLSWKAVAHASYYNVQIYRGKTKVLSTWPAHTSLLLKRSWSFAGHRFKLKPGSYHWYVWPGFGSRTAARYGRRMVAATFKVTKPV